MICRRILRVKSIDIFYIKQNSVMFWQIFVVYKQKNIWYNKGVLAEFEPMPDAMLS